MASADPEPEKKPRQRQRQKTPDDTQSRVRGQVVTTRTEGLPASIDHVLKATTRHIKSLDRERRQLLANIEQLQKALDESRTELAQTRPELATARANLRNYGVGRSDCVHLRRDRPLGGQRGRLLRRHVPTTGPVRRSGHADLWLDASIQAWPAD
jgi:chromosome segregation ATPase